MKKVPLDPKMMRSASVVDPDTWSSFDAACRREHSDGIGFVLTADDGIVGIDLDNCIVDGFVTTAAFKIVDHFNSYTEVSPSGTGLHIFIRANLNRAWKRTNGSRSVEIYGDRRYLTMTGDRAPLSRLAIHDRQDELNAFLAKYDRASSPPRTIARTAPQRDDEDVLQRAANARNGERFRKLWSGDTSAYGHDHNRADLALCNMLWYWSGDEAQVDRLFRRSGLMRDKWDSARGASTYGENLILKAMS
ncbi:phage NrS-1 polymerase family protein [Truepera radiovictrix]|uniref:phage NrS-1 polymerase family protein n=1 Tax=Truepera radiovictrix TaxID=332249 RepID=UPI0011D14141|nr:hypothetical protein [Truepera radiovictrix]WMT56519.1 hypothetical protein RCV51_10955 [Truepera radiovictrix]